MAKDNELVIRINGNTRGYLKSLDEAAKETKRLQKIFNTIAKTGAAVFTAFGAVVILTANQFDEFEHSILSVKTLLDETSFSAQTLDEGFQNLSKGALGALSEFPVTLQAVNKSLFDIVSAGISAEKAVGVLGSTSRLAVAGITSAAIATDGVTTALNAYGLEAKQAELVAAKFFTAQKFGKTTIQELSSFMGTAVSTAKEFGISLDELLASTAAATTGGIKTRRAFTSLVAAIASVAKPTERAVEEAERLGREFNSTALRTKGLKGFLDDLTSSQKFNKQSIEKLFDSVEAQKIIFSLTGAQAEKFQQTVDALSDSQKVLTTFTEAYETQLSSSKNQSIIFKNNLQAVSIMIGAHLSPILTELTQNMTEFLQIIQRNPELTAFIAKILLAGTVTGALATMIGITGIAFLKLRAIMAASAVATAGMSLAVKVLVGSTAIGLLIAFLPEISNLLDNSLIPALAAASIGLFKTRAAMLAATTSTQGLAIAVKGLIGSTGLGLLIAFLPEIIQLIEKFFGDSTEAAKGAASEQKRSLLQQAKDEEEIAKARTRGRSEIELNFIRRQQELRAKAAKIELIQDEDVKRIKLRALALHKDQLLREEKEFEEEKLLASDAASGKELASGKKVTDTKLQGIKDENERIKAFLADQEKERIGFLKRRQELASKAAAAEKEQDAGRRAAALENVKLLTEQLTKEEAAFTVKQKEEQDKKDQNKAKKIAKEQEATEERIRNLKNESEIISASLDEREETERDFLKRRQGIRDQALEASKIKNQEEREASLENIRLKNEELFFEEADFILKQDEMRREHEEIEAEIQAELETLSTEKRKALQKAELDDLKKTFETKEKILSKAAKRDVDSKRKERAAFIIDEEKHGKVVAGLNAFMRTEEFKNAQTAAAQLAQLARSKNVTLKSIGKAAALVQIGINTAKGAIAAYSSLAGIPIIGPALGAAAAAALIVFGVERAAQVQSAQAGGRVAGTGFGDNIPFLLEPGELITPRQNFEEVVSAVKPRRTNF